MFILLAFLLDDELSSESLGFVFSMMMKLKLRVVCLFLLLSSFSSLDAWLVIFGYFDPMMNMVLRAFVLVAWIFGCWMMVDDSEGGCWLFGYWIFEQRFVRASDVLTGFV